MYNPFKLKMIMLIKNYLQETDVSLSLFSFVFLLYFFRIFDTPITQSDIKIYDVKFLKATSGLKTPMINQVLDKETGKTLNLNSAYSFHSFSEYEKNNLTIELVRDPFIRYTEDLYLMKIEIDDDVHYSLTLNELNNRFFERRLITFLLLLLIPFTAIFHCYIKKRPQSPV